MFAGKTRELQRQYNVFKSCKFKIQVFKKQADKRYSENEIITHDGLKFDKEDVFVANSVDDIEKKLKPETQVVMIDEAQFYNKEIVEKIDELVGNNKIVITTVLPTDFRGLTFGVAGDLLARADKITQLFSRCTHQENGVFCHQLATRPLRRGKSKELVVIGGKEMYEPRCRKHHYIEK